MSEVLLKVEELSAAFSEKWVVKNVNMNVEKGEVVAVIGPSGCGKSTFIRCLNRLHEEIPQSSVKGHVFLEGKDIYRRSVDPVVIRRKIGMVFQKPNPFPGMSVYDNVIVGLKLLGLRNKTQLMEIAEHSLRQAALWDEVKDKLKDQGSSLSGGQQQRLCIARALAVQPPILLMDEPTSALDPISTAKIEELLFDLKKEVTIIIVTHNMQQAARVADKTGFFLMGDLLEYGKTSQVFSTPVNKRTEDYITGRFG